MDLKLGILSGARAGEALHFSQPSISVGRHPQVDLRFDPANDRAVSARHALLFFEDGSWHVRDLGSRNGTFVNDQPVQQDARLRSGDRITFGVKGPTVQLASGAGELPGLERAVAAQPMPSRLSTVERVRMELAHRTRRYRAAGIALLIIAIGGISTALFLGDRQRAAWDQERLTMRLHIDSIQWAGSRAVEMLEQQLSDLTRSLRASEQRISELEQGIATALQQGDSGRAAGLREELLEARAGFQNQRSAAELDFASIQAGNRSAVARIFVEFESGEVTSATAFAVRPDGTLLTSRHIMTDAHGEIRPRRIAIQFSDSEQVWPARLLAVSHADLSVVRTENIRGGVPVIKGFNLRPDTLAAGEAVAMLGFPHGGASGGPDQTVGFARPLVSAGVVQQVASDEVQVRGYGAVGASGSPIIDSNGQVVGVVFGGRADPGGHSVFGVSAQVAAQLIDSL